MPPTDDLGPGAGAGVSPTDPGSPGNGRDDSDETAGGDDDELVSAVEDLVRDLLPDGDAPRG